MTHTPGPWEAKDDEVWAGEVHIADCMLYAYDDYFLTHDGTPGTDEDNATVLAAAPDMLALCRDLYAEVGAGGDLDWHLREQGYAERLRVLIEKAEATDGP